MVIIKDNKHMMSSTSEFECVNKQTQAHTSFPIINHYHQGLEPPNRLSEGLHVHEHADPLDCSDYHSGNQDIPVSGLAQDRSKGVGGVETQEEKKYFHRDVLSCGI